MDPNATWQVAVGLAVWLVTYVWLLRTGPESVSALVSMLLGAMPPISIIALGSVGARELNDEGIWPVAGPAFALAAVLLLLLYRPKKWPVHRYWVRFWELRSCVSKPEKARNGTEKPAGKAASTLVGRLWKSFATIIGYLVLALFAVAVGGAGSWGGYQLAFGSVLAGGLWSAGAIVSAVVVFLFGGGDTLADLSDCLDIEAASSGE